MNKNKKKWQKKYKEIGKIIEAAACSVAISFGLYEPKLCVYKEANDCLVSREPTSLVFQPAATRLFQINLIEVDPASHSARRGNCQWSSTDSCLLLVLIVHRHKKRISFEALIKTPVYRVTRFYYCRTNEIVFIRWWAECLIGSLPGRIEASLFPLGKKWIYVTRIQ